MIGPIQWERNPGQPDHVPQSNQSEFCDPRDLNFSFASILLAASRCVPKYLIKFGLEKDLSSLTHSGIPNGVYGRYLLTSIADTMKQSKVPGLTIQ
jgi:hypothetical protein